jgi:hypothetical protein
VTNESPRFELRPDTDGETALVIERRSGFTQAMPGHPALAAPTPEGPRHDARLLLADAPIAVRYRLDRLPAGMQPGPLAQSLTLAYAKERAGEDPLVSAADAARCEAWGVQAAASSVYPLKAEDPDGDYESVSVLTRPLDDATAAMVITYRFPSRAVSPVHWALFSSGAQVGLSWNPGAIPDGVPRIWPESAYLRPGVRGELWPARQAQADALRSQLVITPAEVAALRVRLLRLVGGGEASGNPVDLGQREIYRMYLADVVADRAADEAMRDVLADVHVAHDLRGAAIVLLSALP